MKTLTLVLPLVAMSVLLNSCDNGGESTGGGSADSSSSSSSVSEALYGQMPDGAEARIFTLTNANGMEAKVTELSLIHI